MYRFVATCVATGFFLGGCNFGPKDGEVALGGCPAPTTVDFCVENMVGEVNVVEITVVGGSRGEGKTARGEHLSVTPEFLCVDRGDTIRLEISDEVSEKLRVGTLPRRYGNTWLVGSNTANPGQIELRVPAKLPECDAADAEGKVCEFKYAVVTSTDDCLDPRIHVRN